VFHQADTAEAAESTWEAFLRWIVGTPLTIVVTLVVAAVASKVVKRLIRRGAEHLKEPREGIGGRFIPGTADPRLVARVDTLHALLRNGATVVIWTIAWLIVLDALGINIAPLLAGAGIVGVALGFGAQTLVRDIISGFFMLVEDQFGVGDEVEIQGSVGTPIEGTVEGVTLRATQIRALEGTLWHVANGEMRRVGNRSQRWARVVLDVAVRRDADLDEAGRTLLAAAQEVCDEDRWARAVEAEPELWGVEAVGADTVTMRLAVRVDPPQRLAVQRALRERLARVVRDRELWPPA
jgi:moderate conductance mechanosensitive channel